jgi:hypothetical protein
MAFFMVEGYLPVLPEIYCPLSFFGDEIILMEQRRKLYGRYQ